MMGQVALFKPPPPEPTTPPVRAPRPPKPRQRTRATRADFDIYLEWLREVETLLQAHGADTIEKWRTLPGVADLAVELRGIAEFVEELGGELREIADGLEHLDYQAEREFGGTK